MPSQDVVANSAYVSSYGTYGRDYMSPQPPPPPLVSSAGNSNYTVVKVGLGGGGGNHCSLRDSLYSSVAPPPASSMLNVSDPRLSATYGNPHLGQVRVTSAALEFSSNYTVLPVQRWRFWRPLGDEAWVAFNLGVAQSKSIHVGGKAQPHSVSQP